MTTTGWTIGVAEAAAAFSRGPITSERLKKLEAFCKRFGLRYEDVITNLPDDVRMSVEALNE